MCRSCSGNQPRWRSAVACLFALLAVPLHPRAAVSQDDRTVTVRGTVVDEAGMPVANCRVAVHVPLARKVEAAAPTGEFTVNVPRFGNEVILSAQDQSGELQGMSTLRARQAEPIRVTLRKARELIVTVIDPSNRPVADARVGLEVGSTFLRQGTIAEQLTDTRGRAVLRFPAEAKAETLFAMKRDVGVNFHPLSVGPSEPQTIVLGDNFLFQVRVTDDEDRPLAGVSIQPVSISKGRGFFQVREFSELETTSDAAGLATVRTLPKDLSSRVSLDVRLAGYLAITSASFDPRTAPAEISAALAPQVTIRGKVSAGEATPPSSVSVIAAGVSHRLRPPGGIITSGWHAGPEAVGFRAFCDESGAFELSVARNHYYALVAYAPAMRASKDRIVTPIETRVVLAESPPAPLLMTLGPGTRVFGMATRTLNGTQSVPLSRSMMRLLWQDVESHGKLASNQRLPGAKSESPQLKLSLAQDVTTDGEGQFEFYVPPGKYLLSSAMYGGDPVAVEVTDQKEVKVDFHSTGLPRGFAGAAPIRPQSAPANLIELSGRVVLAADRNRGIADVNVRRIDLGLQPGRAAGGSSPIGTSGGDGSFTMTRPAGESLLLAYTADGLLSSIVKIPATATEVVLPLAPTATFRGRLIDGRTKKPLAGREIDTMMRTDQLMSTSLSAHAITDARGEFVLSGLTPGWPIEIQVVIPAPRTAFGGPGGPPGGFRGRTSMNLKSVTASKAEVVEPGDLSPRDSTPPPLDQLIAGATRSTYVQTGRLEAALGQADLLDQRVLVFAAGSASEICEQFFTLWYGLDEPSLNQALRDASSQFVLLALDSSQPVRRAPNWQTILQQAAIDPPAADDAGLGILEPDGNVVTVTTGRALSSDGKLDAEKLAAFLQKHAQPPPDAEKLLEDALAEAKRAGKRVLVFQSVPFSAPSALVNLFLQAQRDLLAKDCVCVTLSPRYRGAAAAIKRIGGEISSTPWLAVLDDTGESLASTATPGISGPPGTSRVAKLLETTAQKLTPDEIQTLVKALWVP
jgi:hypothetical protein